MLNSLKRMSNNISPGNDGFTVELFRFFWNDIGMFLFRSMNYAHSIGELSVTQKQGVITCIPKGNKDKSLLQKVETYLSTKCCLQNSIIINSFSCKKYIR